MIFRTLLSALFLGILGHFALAGSDGDRSIYVSVPDQRLLLIENGKTIAKYTISTSRFGLGDSWSSYRTPMGAMQVAQKIGANAVPGAVFHGRRLTGEVLAPNANGRDPIVTRIMWLTGLESCNRNAYQRGIYIHGTPVERLLGRPASYGCVRMRSQDVITLFNSINVGTRVTVSNDSVRRIVAQLRTQPAAAPVMVAAVQPKPTHSTAKSTPKLAANPAPTSSHDHRLAAL